MILWFPSHIPKDTVLQYVQEFAKGTFPQILQDKIHSRFPSFVQRKVCLDKDLNEVDIQCAICFEQGDYQLTCGHVFHQQCIARWKQKKRNCPLCRAAL